MQLYDYFRSSAAFRVRLALNYKKLSYEKININLLSGQQLAAEYAQLNPAKLVPLLLTDTADKIHQSLAIISYLDEIHPEPSLLPATAVERAYVQSLALDVACDIHPLNNLRVLKYLKTKLGHTDDEVNQWYHHWVSLGLLSFQQTIQQSQLYSGSYCCGDQFTLADVCLLPQLFNARRFGGDVAAYPLLLKIEAHCQQYEWVREAYPEATA